MIPLVLLARAQFAFDQRFSHRAAAYIACANNEYVLDHYGFSSAGVKDAIPCIPGIVAACRDEHAVLT